MKQTTNAISTTHNIGNLDAAVRLALAFSALYALAVGTGQVSTLYSVLALLSAYPLITAICRWDPVYDIAGISTRRPEFNEAQLLSGHSVTDTQARSVKKNSQDRKAA